jgi:hypothetical protein
MLKQVPAGFEAVTDRDAALPLIEDHIHAAGLPPRRAGHFRALWQGWLHEDMQPSGLVLRRLPALADLIGHATTGTVKRWAQFCDRRLLCAYVPGRLMPSVYPESGQRTRAYLVIRPSAT